VLRRGHDPRMYSGYLIDLAHAVKRAGGRLPALGTAIDGGGLAPRIRRIPYGGPVQHLSRRRTTTAAAICGGRWPFSARATLNARRNRLPANSA